MLFTDGVVEAENPDGEEYIKATSWNREFSSATKLPANSSRLFMPRSSNFGKHLCLLTISR